MSMHEFRQLAASGASNRGRRPDKFTRLGLKTCYYSFRENIPDSRFSSTVGAST